MVELNGKYYFIGRELTVLLQTTKELPVHVFYNPVSKTLLMLSDIPECEYNVYDVKSADHYNDSVMLNLVAVLPNTAFVEWDKELASVIEKPLYRVRQTLCFDQEEIAKRGFDELPEAIEKSIHDGNTVITRLQ